MDITPKQLEWVVKKATAHLATKKDLEAVEDGMARTLTKAFQEHEDRINQKLDDMGRKLDRIERIVTKWPPPSELDQLFTRVNRIERTLKLKPLRRAA